MPTYTALSNALVAVGAKPFATTIQALRDNPLAIAEGDSAAPVNAYGWHPYNKVTVGDTNTGVIWSFAANGAVATVTTPDFADGWEYAFQFERLQTSSGSSTSFNINLFRETAGAYAGASALVASGFSTTLMLNGYAELLNPRLVRSHHVAQGFFAVNTIANALGGFAVGSGGAAHGTAQKILRAQFSCGVGNITGTGAAIYMLRRRNVGA
ncbi:hypothetical protein [Microcystis phage Mae-JY02]